MNNKNSSGLLFNKSEERTYWVTKQAESQNTEDETLTQDLFDPENKKIRILTPEQARKTNNLKLIGLSIGGAVVFTAGSVFFFLGGGPKGFAKKLDALKKYFENKIQKSKLDNINNPHYNWLYSGLIKILDSGSKRFGVINNFNTFKDLLFKRIMHNRVTGKVTGSIHSSITDLFEWIGQKAVSGKYKIFYSSAKDTNSLMTSLFKKVSKEDMSEIIEVNGVKKTRKYWISKLETLNQELEDKYNSGFGQHAIAGRYKKIRKLSQNLTSYFDDKGPFWFWSKKTLNEFVADSAIAKDKLLIQKEIKLLRQSLYYSRKDLAKEANEGILNITRLVPIKDTYKMRILGNIRQNVKEFFRHGKSSSIYEALETRILKDIDSLLKDVNKMPASKTKSELIKEIIQLKNQLVDYKRGTSQQILDIYRKLLSKEEYDELYHSFRESSKKLDSAIKAESEDFVDKIRDLATGSAPTDILTMLSAFVTLGYYLKKSDNTQQKESVALKYGIPAIAGVITTLFCNAKMYAGSKSIIFGGISTLLVGKLGAAADKLLKEKQIKMSDVAKKEEESEIKEA